MRSLALIVILPYASHCLDARPRSLVRRGVLAQSLLFVAPGAAVAGIADQLEAASRASEITYSQNGSAPGQHAIDATPRPTQARTLPGWRPATIQWVQRRTLPWSREP